LKKILTKCREEMSGIQYDAERPLLIIGLEGEKLSKYSRKVLPSFVSLQEEDGKAEILYQFMSERDLALEILKIVTGMEVRERRERGFSFLCMKRKKRDEKFENKMINNPLIVQIRKVVDLIDQGEDNGIKSGKQSLLRKNKFNKSHLEM